MVGEQSLVPKIGESPSWHGARQRQRPPQPQSGSQGL